MPDIQQQIARMEKSLDESDKLIFDKAKNSVSHINSPEKIKDFVENTYIELKKIEPNEIAKLMKDDFYKQYLEREVSTFVDLINTFANDMMNPKLDDNYKLNPLIAKYESQYPLLVKKEYEKALERKKIFENKELELQFNEILEQIDECDNLIYNNIKNSISHIDSPSKIKEVVENSYDYFGHLYIIGLNATKNFKYSLN
jgi:hypothetical protein